jgi:VanZ family protein
LLPLRFPRLWSALGWLLVASVVIGSLIPGPMLEKVAAVDDKIMHAGAYFFLMIWFAGFYRRAVYPVIASVLLALGIGLDVLQTFTETRSFDLYDIGMNCAGVLVGLALSVSLIGGWCQRVEQRLLS